MGKTIWIDLDNSPHVPLFIPIIKNLESRGNKVVVTARAFAQTIELLRKTNIPFRVIGSHYGRNKFYKVAGLLIRAYQLLRYIKNFHPDAAMNHGSRSQVLACWLLRIPVFCGLDYEHTESFIFSRFATKLWIPAGISEHGIKAIGAPENKIVRYKNYKEEIYLSGFTPDKNFRKNLGVPEYLTLVTLRPPATHANYHDSQSEKLLMELITLLKSNSGIFTICLPRTKMQKTELLNSVSDRFIIPENVIDGLNLAFHSDLVISGGGTMNREAALLGTPVYSIFSGTLGSLDAHMQKKGLITLIRNRNDISKIELNKKEKRNNYEINHQLAAYLISELLKLPKDARSHHKID